MFLVKMVLIVFMIPVMMAHIYSALTIIRVGGVPCMHVVSTSSRVLERGNTKLSGPPCFSFSVRVLELGRLE